MLMLSSTVLVKIVVELGLLVRVVGDSLDGRGMLTG